MKKILLTVFVGLAITIGFAQTATNFTTNDCVPISHTLFTELDAGKVIVICWVMPCGTCISPALTDATTVQGYALSHPGRVKFYLVDDTGDSNCSTLNSWANTNGITTDAVFSNSGNVIKMTDYGQSGMPKTVVLGGINHTVFYNQNNSVSQSDLQTAITNALNAPLGIIENKSTGMALNVFPNPTAGNTKIIYTLTNSSDVKIDVTNILGEKVSTVVLGIQAAGNQEYEINLELLSAGSYFIKLNAGEATETVKVTVSH